MYGKCQQETSVLRKKKLAEPIIYTQFERSWNISPTHARSHDQKQIQQPWKARKMGVRPKIAPSMLSSDFVNLASEADTTILAFNSTILIAFLDKCY